MFSILPSQVWNSLVFLSIMYYKNLQQKNSILNLFLQDVVATQESQLLTAGPERPSSSAHPDEVNDNYIVFLELGTSSSHHLALSSTAALRLAQLEAATAALEPTALLGRFKLYINLNQSPVVLKGVNAGTHAATDLPARKSFISITGYRFTPFG